MTDLQEFEKTLNPEQNPTVITISTKFAKSDVAVSMTIKGDTQIETIQGFNKLAATVSEPIRDLTAIEKLHMANLADRARHPVRKSPQAWGGRQ